MLMAFIMFAKWWKFTKNKTQLHHYYYFEFSKKLDKVYNDLKD
jgi:hypothetical protein